MSANTSFRRRRIVWRVTRNAIAVIAATSAALAMLTPTRLARADDDSYINAVMNIVGQTNFTRQELLNRGNDICTGLRNGKQFDSRWVLYYLVAPAQHELCPDTL